MLAHLRPALVVLALLTLVTGVAYPLVVTGIAQALFPFQAQGSLISKDGKVVGSTLIGQPFDDPKYFWGRPSATSPFANNAASSSGSNLSPTNPDLVKAVQGRVDALRAADPGNTAPVPVDLVTASASGLDPHISPAAALYQVGRVARARKLDPEVVRQLVERHTEPRTLGLLGEPRVNVLALNMALDRKQAVLAPGLSPWVKPPSRSDTMSRLLLTFALCTAALAIPWQMWAFVARQGTRRSTETGSWRPRRLLFTVVLGVGILAVPVQGAFAQKQDGSPAATPTAAGGSAETTAAAPESDGQRFGFFRRLFNAYVDEFKDTGDSGPEPPRRAMPSPWDSPPFPGSEYQGYPLIGVPYSTKEWPLMKALGGTWIGDWMKENRLQVYGWFTGAGNWSSSSHSNLPASYWIDPNTANLDQALIRAERQVDTVQQDHIDWGFRSTWFYGIDYRYTTAGGWFSDQLLKHNYLYGYDPTEQYADVYFPGVAQGMVLRVGRWIATPDIETQFAPDNFMGSHSLLFTFDTYTQTGVMASFQLNKNWMVQIGVHAGTDMAPWYAGAVPTGFLGVRWVAPANNDSLYIVLNSINTAKFQRFTVDGQPAGHDNFNYLVGTWTHRFTPMIFTSTESYYMWQRDAVVGGTPSIGPVRSFGGGGGIGADLPGLSNTYGVLNYTMFGISKRDYLTVRNEWWRDERGERSGFKTTYTSNSIGWSHQLSDVFTIRPEVAYFHSYDTKAFDLGHKNYLWQGGIDMTARF